VQGAEQELVDDVAPQLAQTLAGLRALRLGQDEQPEQSALRQQVRVACNVPKSISFYNNTFVSHQRKAAVNVNSQEINEVK
jgi:phosphoribosylformylglycinamidine (FGAM) synthase-like enzyme